MNINLPIALVAGFISFLSPCIFPLIPSYLGYIGATTYDDGFKRSRGSIWRILFFILGFTIVFMIMGVLFSSIGVILTRYSRLINYISGSIIIILGINIIFNIIKFLDYEKKAEVKKGKGLFTTLLIGMAFGAGWSPCIGPILASILFLASNSSTYIEGGLLLTAYSIGLGIPFLLSGLFISHFQERTTFLRKNLIIIRRVSGLLLISIGILIFSGKLWSINQLLATLSINFQSLYSDYGVLINIIFSIQLISPLYPLIKGIINKKKFLIIRITLSVLFLTLSISSLMGFINWGDTIGSYLTFQGL